MPDPIYTPANTRVAYQLHWSVTLFARQAWPGKESWWPELEAVTEADGVRLLEFQLSDVTTGMFLVSSKPDVSPSDIIRSIKGRLQHCIRAAIPKFWQGHYSIVSIGDAKNDVLQNYVGQQLERHPQADARATERLSEYQFSDPAIDLTALRASSHGRFLNNLHIVIRTASSLPDTRYEWLATSQAMAIGTCRKKEWLLSRLAPVGNHFHALVGCHVTDPPGEVVLSLMNNLAYAHGMKPVYEHGFYVGTFGPYDHGAVRWKLKLAGGPSCQ